MPKLIYHAKIEEQGDGFIGYIPDVAGLEKVIGEGKTPDDCCRDLQSRLNLLVHIRVGMRKHVPEPNEYIEGLRAITINAQRNVLVVNGINKKYQTGFLGLLEKLYYDPILTNNLEDAVRHLQQGKIYAVITESKELHKAVQEYAPQAPFIFYPIMKLNDLKKFKNPKAQHIPSEGGLDQLEAALIKYL